MKKKKHNDYQVVPYPKLRRGLAVMLRSARSKSMIHGLFEVDVTRAREFLRDHKAKTGESLSFTEIGLGSPVSLERGGIARRRSGDTPLTTSINECILIL